MLSDDELADLLRNVQHHGLFQTTTLDSHRVYDIVSELQDFRRERSASEDADVCPLCQRDRDCYD